MGTERIVHNLHFRDNVEKQTVCDKGEHFSGRLYYLDNNSEKTSLESKICLLSVLFKARKCFFLFSQIVRDLHLVTK